MSKKAKIILVVLVLLSLVWVGFNLYGQRVTGSVDRVFMSEEQKEEAKPTVRMIKNPTYTVCTDSDQLEQYDDLYLSLITQCKDRYGKDILDADHIHYEPIDWTKKGEQVIHYTITDDSGNSLKVDCTVVLTDPINTGH